MNNVAIFGLSQGWTCRGGKYSARTNRKYSAHTNGKYSATNGIFSVPTEIKL